MSLRLRLALIFALLAAVGIAAVGAASYYVTDTQLIDQIDAFLKERADEIESGDRRRTADTVDDLPFDPDAAVQVIDDKGNIKARVGPPLPVSDRDRRIADEGGRPLYRNITADGEPYRMVTVNGGNNEALQVARKLGETMRVLAGLRTALYAIGAALTAAAAAGGWIIAARTARPLEELTATAERVAATEDMSVAVKAGGVDEVRRLAIAFQEMLGSLATSREQQRRLVMDAGHELRTPITSLRTAAELLERTSNLDEEERRRLASIVGEESAALTDLVDELVDLATTTNSPDRKTETIELASLASEVIGRFEQRTGRSVTTDFDGTTVKGAPGELERALLNLLGNAEKFSSPDSPIAVSIKEGRVAVTDDGPGISAEDRPHVFDRFYRSTSARNQPGSGLGLAIVKRIVENHGGAVFATEGFAGGAEVGFTLPRI